MGVLLESYAKILVILLIGKAKELDANLLKIENENKMISIWKKHQMDGNTYSTSYIRNVYE